MRWALVILILSSCSPNWHLKQAERHIKKAQLKGATVRVDTVYKTVEVIVPEVRVDTLFKRVNFRDTIELWQDRFHVKVKVDTLLKSVYIEGKCENDTVKIDVPVIVKQEIKSGIDWWWLLVVGGGIIITMVLLDKMIKK